MAEDETRTEDELADDLAAPAQDADEPAPAALDAEDDDPGAPEADDPGGADEDPGRDDPEPEKPSFQPPPPDRLEGAIEAVLVVAGDVVRVERLRDLLGLPSVKPLREALDAIRARWAEARLALEIEDVAGGVRVVTRPEYAEYVGRLSRKPVSDKLSKALLETLCIVAYKQPVGRAEVERIRGVQAGDALRQLLDRKLLKVVGRSEQAGRPLLYGTTQQFLTAFGLGDIKDLPSPEDLKRL